MSTSQRDRDRMKARRQNPVLHAHDLIVQRACVEREKIERRRLREIADKVAGFVRSTRKR